MPIREIIEKYRIELTSTKDLTAGRASEILVELSALLGNIVEDIREKDMAYINSVATLYQMDERPSMVRIKLLTSQQYKDKIEAKDNKTICSALIKSLASYLKIKEEEMKESRKL